MIPSQHIIEPNLKNKANWKIGTTSTILEQIHRKDINIAIYERDISALTNESNNLLKQDIELRSSGDIDRIIHDVVKVINPNKHPLIIQDIKELLQHFNATTELNNFRLLLATINSNMCRRFHTDINDLRMLCTYSGPGTLWLTDDNINHEALRECADNNQIVIEESKIKQAKTGSIVLLKGAMYPQSKVKAAVHRSPTIEESGEKRLLLRIDTNETLNF